MAVCRVLLRLEWESGGEPESLGCVCVCVSVGHVCVNVFIDTSRDTSIVRWELVTWGGPGCECWDEWVSGLTPALGFGPLGKWRLSPLCRAGPGSQSWGCLLRWRGRRPGEDAVDVGPILALGRKTHAKGSGLFLDSCPDNKSGS